MFSKLKHYGELVMFSHTIFSLPFAIFAYLLATNGEIELNVLLWAIVALFGARNGANAWNRIADYHIDLANSRTANRHLQTKKVSLKEAWIITIVCYVIYILAASQINLMCLILSPIPIIFFTIYPYTKRFTIFCHVFLGFSCSMAILGAWIAAKGLFFSIDFNTGIMSIEMIPVILFIAILLWNAGFDTIYGTQDYDHDIKHNIKSMAVGFGVSGALLIAKLLHGVMMLCMFSLVILSPNLGIIYIIGLCIASVVYIIEHNVVDTNNQIIMKLASYKLNQVISLTICLFGILDIYL